MSIPRILLWASVVGFLGAGACNTGRSASEMARETARLEKELANLETANDAMARQHDQLEADLEATRALCAEARSALAMRDGLRDRLAGFGATADRSSLTVASESGGQLRASGLGGSGGAVSPAGGGGAGAGPGGGTPGSSPGSRSQGPYRGLAFKHDVAKGESLWVIAGYDRYYGDADRWPEIYDANAYQIQDPHWIFVGQRLYIPKL